MSEPIKIPGGVAVERLDDSVINTPPAPEEIQKEQIDGPYMTSVEPSFFEAVGERIPQVSPVVALFRRLDIEGIGIETPFSHLTQGEPIEQDPEGIVDRLDQAGVLSQLTPQDLASFADVKTTKEFDTKVEHFRERQQTARQLADKGFVQQLVGEFLAYSSDPATLIVDSLSGGITRGPMLARFLSGGARAAAANALIDASLTVDERTYTPAEIGFTVAASFGLGGAFGVALGRNTTTKGLSTDRRQPLKDKHPELGDTPNEAVVPKFFFEGDDPAIPRTADRVSPDGIRRAADPEDPKSPQAERPASEKVEPLPKVTQQSDGIDPQLVARANRLLSEDELMKAREAVDDISVLENPTEIQLTRLEQATKRLDDHEDAKRAVQEIKDAQGAPPRSIDEVPEVQRQFEGLDYVRDAQRAHEDYLRSRQTEADEVADDIDAVDPESEGVEPIVNDTPETRGVGSDQVADSVLMNDTAFGLYREYADTLVDSYAPDIQPGDASIVSQVFRRMTPATRAAVVENPHVRVLASRMFTHPWTKKGDEFNPTGWEDQSRRMMYGPETIRVKKHREAFNEWFDSAKKDGRWVGMPKLVQFSAQREFAELVGKALQDLNSGRTPDVHPAVMKAADAFDEFMETHWAQMQRTGVIPEDMARPYKYYIPQIVDRSSARQFVNEFSDSSTGIDALSKLYAKGMNVELKQRLRELVEEAEGGQVRPETEQRLRSLEESLLKVISQAYARRAYSHDLSARGMTDVDAIGLHLENVDAVRDLLEDNLVRKAPDGSDTRAIQTEIDNIIESLTRSQKKKSDISTPNRLKGRMDLDMDATINYKNRRGETKTLRLGDIYAKDVNHSAHNYGRWAAAEATLARDGTSVFQIRKAIDELEKESRDSSWNPEAPTTEDIKLLEYGYRAVLNLPAHAVEENAMRVSNALKNITYASKMGAAFIHSFSEAYTIAAQMGVRETFKELPTLAKIIKSYANGKIDPGLHEELYALNGAVFNSLELSLAGSRFDTDLTGVSGNKWLDAFESGAEGYKRILSYANMLPVTTDISRQFATVMQLKQLDRAIRGEKMPSWWDGIRRQYGLSDQSMARLRDHFTSDKVTRKNDGSIDWDGSIGLNDMPAETRLALEDFLYRSATTMIQEVHRGNLPMFMTGPVGSLLLQFRSFEVASTSRHLIADVSRNDLLAYNKFAGSALIATLGYAARTYAFSGGDTEVLEERLQPDRVVANGIAYSVSAGAMPTVIDSITPFFTGGVTPFNRYRTTGMSDDVFSAIGVGSAPFSSVLQNAYTATGAIAQMPYDIAAGEGAQLSRQQARAIMSIVGADTLWFLRPGKEYILANMPKESDLERGNILTATGLDD